MKRVLVSLVAIFTCAVVLAQPLQRVAPEKAGMDPVRLSNVDKIIESSIEKGEIPGAVLAVVRDGKMAYIKSYGNKRVYPTIEKMEISTVFDLASVSKPVGCAISIMQLVEQGRVRLTDNVSMYIDGFKGYQDPETGKTIDIRIVDLLTHSSGLPPYAPAAELVAKYGSPAPDGLMEYISNCKRDFKPTTKFQYSCLNFITLQNVLENITGLKLEEYSKRNVFEVLGMKNTTFNPSQEMFPMIAPT
ncbi:MAG: serine hydrolase, partial [Bacteroidales bacterium]|nr:serine hydrolase [Bacteroidales bacterium]